MTSISATGTLSLRQSGGDIQYDSGSGWTTASLFPVTITNSDTGTLLTVLFTTDITLSGGTSYFVCGSESIQFGSRTLETDGTTPTITIDGTSDYPGLIANGSAGANGYDDISIVNLAVEVVNGSTLATSGGWVAQSYFGKAAANNIIVNCTSSGDIPGSGGGIAGAFTGSSGGNVTIRGCRTTGEIQNSAGGIVGQSAGSSGTITITECFSTGAMTSGSGGGIAGLYLGEAGNATISKCYSKGNIGSGGGGIASLYAGDNSGYVSISHCYSVGTIGDNAGGIVGRYAGTNDGTVSIGFSYTTGSISATGGGGILGANPGAYLITFCYTSGTRLGSTGGIVSGSASDEETNYSEGNNSNGGVWNAANAGSTITSSTWMTVEVGEPYQFSVFLYSPYVLANILSDYTFETTASATISAGASTVSGYGSSFLIVDPPASVSIDEFTGVITATEPGTYSLKIVGGDFGSSTSFTLTVTEAVVPTPSRTTPFAGFRLSGFDVFNSLLAGAPLVIERLETPNLRFKSYADYLAYRKSLSTIR